MEDGNLGFIYEAIQLTESYEGRTSSHTHSESAGFRQIRDKTTQVMPYVPMLVAAGLEAFVGVLAVAMSLGSCICIRTYGDNARRGFWWLWYTYLFLALSVAILPSL